MLVKLVNKLGKAGEIKAPAAARSSKAYIADSLSVQKFEPLASIATSKATARFEAELSEAFATYSDLTDAELIAARKSGGYTAPIALSAAKSATGKVVEKRLGELGLSADLTRVLAGATEYTFGPASEPLVRPIQALTAADTLAKLPKGSAQKILKHVDAAHNDIERALILKSVGPRRNALLAGTPAEAKAAQSEIEGYAAIIRGTPLSFLLERSTILSGNAGRIASLAQNFSNTCVAASTIGAMATADPFMTWVLKAAGPLDVRNPSGLVARLERAILTSDVTGERGNHWDIPSAFRNVNFEVQQLLRQSLAEGVLTQAQAQSVYDLLAPADRLHQLKLTDGVVETPADYQKFQGIIGQFPKHFAEADRALALLRASKLPKADTILTDGPTLLELGQSTLQQPKGTAPDHMGGLFLRSKTHVDYNRVKYLYRLEADPAHTDRFAQVIDAGQPTLLRRGDPEDLPHNYSHCLTAYATRGQGAAREFLVLDPMHGAGRWVSTAEFNSPFSGMSYFFGHSHPKLGVGRAAQGRPEL